MTTKFKEQKIKEISGPQKKKLRITLLNRSYFQKRVIEKGSIVGYVLSPNSKISIQKHAKKKQSTEAVHTKNVELERILAKGVGDRLGDFSTAKTSRMPAETRSTKSVKLLPALLPKLRQTSINWPNRDLIKLSETEEQK